MMTNPDASPEIGLRLGQTATPAFGEWLAGEIEAADRTDLSVRPIEAEVRPGGLSSGVVELWVALGGTAAILGPMVKPAMEFLWKKIFEYLKGSDTPDHPVPPTIQIVVLGDIFTIDPAEMSRDLPEPLARRLAEAQGGA